MKLIIKLIGSVVLFVISIILIGFFLKSAVYNKTNFRNTVKNDWFGFEFKYPNNLSIKSIGPNSSQLRILAGEIISGTVSPSFETYEFSDNGNPIFSAEIFYENITPLTVEGYIDPGYLYHYGKCDGRWLDIKPEPVKTFKLNNNDILEVKVEGNVLVKCYYLKNKKGNLIVFSSEIFKNKSEIKKADNMIKSVLSTVRFY